eukprot:6555104-Prymnesium_polylepis.1
MADPAGGAAAAKKPRVKKGYPRGIIDHPTGVYQARIQKINDAAKRVNENRPIPGLFKTIEDAVTAQAAAQLKFDNGEEVWPAPKFNEPRNARGQGPKKPPWWTNGKKKWNRGAPLSKFGKGIGRGGKGKKDEEQLETVPLPAEREAVSNDCVRDFLTVPNTSGQENAENVLPAVGLAPLPPIPVPAGLEAS